MTIISSILKKASLLSFFFILSLFTSGRCLWSESDTVVVYKYIYKTDTVWIESKPIRDTIVIDKLPKIEEANLIIDTASQKAELFIFSSGGSATIPINRIILSDNKPILKGMKKLTLLGLTFLTINSVLFAQDYNRLNLSPFIRFNFDGQIKKYSDSEEYYSGEEFYHSSATIGLEGNVPLNGRLSFSPRLSYTFKRSPNTTKITSTFIKGDQSYTRIHYQASGTSNFYFSEGDLLINNFLPLNKALQCRLIGGFRADYFLYEKELSFSEREQGYNEFNKFMVSSVGGFSFDIKNRIFVEMEYSRAITNTIKNDLLTMKYSAISLTFGCYLF